MKKLLSHVESILEYTGQCGCLEDFQCNRMLVEATVFNLMQIGELAKFSLGDEAKASIPSVPWRQIYGMRNRIVHGYEGVNMSIVWDVVKNDIPALKKELTCAIENAAQ